MSKEKIEEWIEENNLQGKYKILSYAGNMTKKSLFLDSNRNVKFSCAGAIFKRNIKRNIDTIFNPTKEEKKESIRRSNLKKYGGHPSRTEDFKNKVRKTNIEKYGVSNIMKSRKGREKLENSMIEKYGVSHFSKTKAFKALVKKSYDNKSKEEMEIIKNRRNKSVKLRFGHLGLAHKSIQEKKIETNLERYGTENPLQNKEIQEKMIKTNLERYGVKYTTSDPTTAKKMFDSKIKSGVYRSHKGKTVKEWAEEIGFSQSYFSLLVRKLGFEDAVNLKPSDGSSLESLIKNFLLEEGEDYIQNRQLLGTKFRPDFLLEKRKLVIECDGLWYHSEAHEAFRGRSYHKHKKEAYEAAGYDSLFFREDELLEKFDIVKSITKNKLKKSKRTFGRKCKIKSVESKTAARFLDENHLMGKGTGRAYGLYHNADLLAIIQVRWKKKDIKLLEISRFCTRMGETVVGGWSKLIKHAKEKEKPTTIMTFIDRRYGTGNYLEKMGWIKSNGYISFKWADLDKKKTVHRMKFPGSSGYEHGFTKIWDCGQAKYCLSV